MSLAHLPLTDAHSSELTANFTTRWLILYLPKDNKSKETETRQKTQLGANPDLPSALTQH